MFSTHSTLERADGCLFSRKNLEQPNLPYPIPKTDCAGVQPAGTDHVAHIPGMSLQANQGPQANASMDLTIHKHPVEKIQLSSLRNTIANEEARDCAVFGGHIAIRNRFERSLVAQHQRLPGLVSNMTGLESLLDMDEELDGADFNNQYLNVEEELGGQAIDVHECVERTAGDACEERIWEHVNMDLGLPNRIDVETLYGM